MSAKGRSCPHTHARAPTLSPSLSLSLALSHTHNIRTRTRTRTRSHASTHRDRGRRRRGLCGGAAGKILRRVLRRIANGLTDPGELGDVSTMADPAVVEQLIRTAKDAH